MKPYLTRLLVLAVAAFALPAYGQVTVFGSAKIKPTYYGNTDNNSDLEDAPLFNEAGWASGEHVRAELRLGVSAKGDNWRAKIIAETDMIMEKDTADRSFYASVSKNNLPNQGSEFGIERAELAYTFAKPFELSTGWDIRALDIKSGGLVFGDDHPFIGAKGQIAQNTGYELLYLMIQNRDTIGVTDSPIKGDWRAYSLKVDQTIPFGAGKVTVSPFAAASNDKDKEANAYYFGAEVTGKIGLFVPSAEFAYVTGSFANGTDIASYAGFLGTEVGVAKAFNPYVAIRYTKGDPDATDKKVEGFVGITDIGRFTPLMGMDGNILGEHLASGANKYGSPLYSYSPERALGTNVYGGIGNGGSGDNPGQRLLAIGARGDLSDFVPKLSYKAQVFFIQYDTTKQLLNVKTPGTDVGRYAMTTFDVQLSYAVAKNFSVDYIFSVLLPGAGLEDQINASDPAMIHAATLAWNF